MGGKYGEAKRGGCSDVAKGCVLGARGGGGALTLVLGTHCKTDSRTCGCRLEKGGLSRTQKLSEGGAVRGVFPVGAVVLSLASARKASWISYN